MTRISSGNKIVEHSNPNTKLVTFSNNHSHYTNHNQAMFKKKCLIIEDSEIAIVNLNMQLEKLSIFDISVARNYNQARSFLSNDKYDLIF
jgi:hypothetical protein